MNSEVKEKLEVGKEDKDTKMVRVEVPTETHRKVMQHQAKLIGQRGRFVTIAETCVDLLIKATRNIKLSES